MTGRLRWAAIALILSAGCGFGQQQSQPQPNKLLTGKLIYVAPMPNELDRWVTEDLRAWERYHVSTDPEGVDLEMTSNARPEDTHFVWRNGLPKKQAPNKKQPQVLSVTVVDWVTKAWLWRADILDKKLKKDEPPPPLGPHTKIYAHGMTPDQIAATITRTFREYVQQLQQNGAQHP
ncbi:MAG: hypothetical protein ACRD3T_08440 [Terriglobia bacterium]